MAELTPKVRLQPSLLDRLTDDEPDKQVESREKRVLSPEKLRESVRRDQTWLFNTVHLAAVEDLSEHPYVQDSVLNFGVPDVAGRTVSTIDRPALEAQLLRAIKRFEPRLLPNSIRVKLIVDPELAGHNAMAFSIQAELWAQPLPIRLYLRTQIDLESGDARVSEVGVD
jgi:type VI secretion system protein ImpF